MFSSFGSGGLTVEVFTYNILSPPLAGPDYFVKCRPEDLDGKTRLKRVQNKLSDPISRKAIIALQEVCLAWSGPLHTFFASKGYSFHYTSYAGDYTGFMGVALAWPAAVYECKDMQVCCVAETKSTPWPKAPPDGCLAGILKRIGCKKATFDPWQAASERTNRMILAWLQPTAHGLSEVGFVVSTYHMPCLFGSAAKLQVMNIHASLVAQCLIDFADGMPALVMGDFNIKPRDSTYKMLTTATLPEDHEERPVSAPDDTWAAVPLQRRLCSAYSIAGGEPEFTNYAFTKWDLKGGRPPFIETLDYIFISDDWQVESCTPLPKAQRFPGPLPTQDEPSDHISIGAKLHLPRKQFGRAQTLQMERQLERQSRKCIGCRCRSAPP